MVSLKESVVAKYQGCLDEPTCKIPVDFFGEWAESYIKELEQHMKEKRRGSVMTENETYYYDLATVQLLRFLRGETKKEVAQENE